MNENKSPLASLTIVPLLVSLIIAVLGQCGIGVTEDETQIIINAVAAIIAIVGRWRAGGISLTAKVFRNKGGAAMLILAVLLLLSAVGCESSNPAAENYFQRMAARVSAMADACDPNSPTHTDPACLTGWRVFSDDLRMYEIMLRGGDPNGAR